MLLHHLLTMDEAAASLNIGNSKKTDATLFKPSEHNGTTYIWKALLFELGFLMGWKSVCECLQQALKLVVSDRS